MIQNEELFNESRFVEPNDARQSEVIAKHCAGVAERIRDAHSKEEATGIADDACQAFRRECTSSIVGDALLRHIRSQLSLHWG